MNLNYSINGISFSSLGIIVTSSEGVLDGLALKEPFSVNWPDAHGEVVDLSRPRYEAREIKLDCVLLASGPGDLQDKLNALTAQLAKTGTQRLRINPEAGRPLVYEVYCKNGYSVEKKWRDTTIIARFSLTLIEPQPVKWVLSAVTGAASIRLTTTGPLTMYWGDGSKTEVFGAGQILNHTYGGTAGTVYYAILSGELERMTVLDKTNLTELWPLLY